MNSLANIKRFKVIIHFCALSGATIVTIENTFNQISSINKWRIELNKRCLCKTIIVYGAKIARAAFFGATITHMAKWL